MVLETQLVLHAEGEVLSPARGGDDTVSYRLLQFRFRSTGFLRDREVLFQSSGAAYRHRATYTDQFAVFHVENFFILVV